VTTSSATLTADALLGAVTGLRRVLRRRLRGQVPGPPLRGAQVELLQRVEAEPGIGVAGAAQSLHLAGNSVSTLVNQLVTAGYLLRETDPADRRAVRLFLTDAATERLVRWRSIRRELVGDALDRLPAAEVDALAAALPALHHLLDELAYAEEAP
jgi:DNA-binding MarR family transcriptional regulator